MMNTREDFVGPVNLGNPEEFTILDLAKKIIKLTNSKSQLVFKELTEDDPKKRKPDISLAEKELNWKPSTSLKEGLAYTKEYFNKLLGKVRIIMKNSFTSVIVPTYNRANFVGETIESILNQTYVILS